MIFDAVKNECLAVTITDTGIWTSAARQTWTGAEDVALTQLTTKFPGQGARTVVVHCAGGGWKPTIRPPKHLRPHLIRNLRGRASPTRST